VPAKLSYCCPIVACSLRARVVFSVGDYPWTELLGKRPPNTPPLAPGKCMRRVSQDTNNVACRLAGWLCPAMCRDAPWPHGQFARLGMVSKTKPPTFRSRRSPSCRRTQFTYLIKKPARAARAPLSTLRDAERGYGSDEACIVRVASFRPSPPRTP